MADTIFISVALGWLLLSIDSGKLCLCYRGPWWLPLRIGSGEINARSGIALTMMTLHNIFVRGSHATYAARILYLLASVIS